MKILALEDLFGMTEKEVKAHIVKEYSDGNKQEVAARLKKLTVLIAYESVGSWGCDSSSWFLFVEKRTGKIYENYGSHCSRYGFEGQFNPEETNFEYLLPHFSLPCDGCEDDCKENNNAAIERIKKLAPIP